MMLAGFEDPTSGTITLEGRRLEQRAGAPARHRHGVPELRAVPAHDGRREPRVPAADARRARRRRSGRASRARSRWCACRSCATASRRSSPAGSSSASRWRARSCTARKLVLMDEPLGALDKQLREQMQLEIKHLHDELGVTVVYVTHDQSEALTMSDRIAVFHHGRIQQLAQPADALRAARERLRRVLHRREQPLRRHARRARRRALPRAARRRHGGRRRRSPPTSRSMRPVVLSLRPERVEIGGAGRRVNRFAGAAARGHLPRRPLQAAPARGGQRRLHRQGAGDRGRRLQPRRRADGIVARAGVRRASGRFEHLALAFASSLLTSAALCARRIWNRARPSDPV